MSGLADTITFARPAARNVALAKSIVVEGGAIVRKRDAPQVAAYAFREVAVSGLADLAVAVEGAAGRGEIAIRGKPRAPTGRRAIYDDHEKGPAGLDVMPRRWVAFDWDGIETEGDPLRDPETGARHALLRLPPEFRDASCLWQVSASAGLKPGFRLRTWHWLDHPCTGADIKVWCAPAIERRLLDPVTLVEAQPHFLAVRVVGGPDPCPSRFGILRLAHGTVPVPDIEGIRRRREHRLRDERRRAERTWARGPGRDHDYAERRIAACVEAVRAAPDGTKHPTYVAEAARAKAICDRFSLDWQPVRRELRDAYEASLEPGEARRRRASSTEGVLRWVERRAAV